MAKPVASLKSTLNKSAMQKYRAYASEINNLWQVFRVKTNPDWIFSNDRSGFYYLENNPHAVIFGLAPAPKLSNPKLFKHD